MRFDEAQRHGAIAQRSDRDGAVEAGAVADMATPAEAGDLNAEPDRILIVIDPHLDDALHKATGGALAP